MITLTTGKKLIVRDRIEEVVGKAINYRQLCNGAIRVVAEAKSDAAPEESAAGAEI
jgi:uncharacterized protein YlzI (FlbEa/FlbD family)